MEWPQITIITPSLNQGQFLRRTIESVLSQNYANLQYIIMDGGSTDNSVSIIQEYSRHLDYWVSERDGGQPQAINRALARATGQVVGYINSDDWYSPGALQLVGRRFADPALDWVIGGCRYEGPNQDELRHARIPEDPARWVGEGPWLPQASSFWSRRVFASLGPFRTDLQYCFDSEFALRLLFAGIRPLSVPEVLAHRWLHEDCKTVANSERFIEEEERFLEIFRSNLSVAQLRTSTILRCRVRLNHYLHSKQWLKLVSQFCRLCLLSPRSAFALLRSLTFRRMDPRLL